MKTRPTPDFATKELKERKAPVPPRVPQPRRSGVSGERRTLRFQRMAALARAAATPAPTPRLRQPAVHLPSSILHPLRLRLSLSASVGEKAGVRCRLRSLVLLFACFAVLLPAPAQVWLTNSLTLSETNPTYDGADLVISGAWVAVAMDGPPAFNSLLLTNGTVLTHSACTASQTHKLDLTVSRGPDTAANLDR